MRIVKKQEFYSLPEGTIYAELQPIIIEGLFIKGKTLFDDDNNPIDFIHYSIGDCIEGSFGSHDDYNMIEVMINDSSVEYGLDVDSGCREGCYDDSQLYVVYSKKDLEKIIGVFQKGIEGIKNENNKR